MKKLLKVVLFSIFSSSFIFGSSSLWSAAQSFDADGKPVCDSQGSVPTPAPFVFTAVDSRMTLKPRKILESSKKLKLNDPELLELINIIELRAQAFFYAIWESSARQALTKSIPANYPQRKIILQKQTRDAVNKSSDAYLASSRRVQRKLSLIDSCANLRHVFTYCSLDKIVADGVLRSEQSKSGKLSSQDVKFQLDSIGADLQIAEKCTEEPFFGYIKCLQDVYSIASNEVGLRCSLPLFLEFLNPSASIVNQIGKAAFSLQIRIAIDSICAEPVAVSSSTKRTSCKIKEFKQNVTRTIAEQGKKTCVCLYNVDELNNLLLKKIGDLPEHLKEQILLLVKSEDVESLNHYISIWRKKMGVDATKVFLCPRVSKKVKEEFRNILLCINPKSLSNANATQCDAENIWPKLVERFTQLKLRYLIKPEKSAQRVDVQSPTDPLKEKELAAQEAARQLLAEEKIAAKKQVARQKAPSPVTGADKKSNKKKKNEGVAPAPAPVEKPLQKQSFVSINQAVEIARQHLPVFIVATYEDAPEEGWIVCETDKKKSRSVEDCTGMEARNPLDEYSPEFNCIKDLSRVNTDGLYQCKIFLYPDLCKCGKNFLSNLDYSGLPKYKRPNDNNHAFSNLVEKIYGNLGTVDKIETLHNGWVKIYISLPGRMCWLGNMMEDACKKGPNGVFEFIILKKDKNPDSYAFCVHRFFRPAKK